MISRLIIKIKKKLGLTNEIIEYRKQGVSIGEKTDIICCNLDQTHPHLIEIGNNCTLTHCTLLTHDATTKKELKKSKIGIIKIGNNVFVGWNSIILPNVKIGDNCIIGAGCVVGKNIPDNSVVVGNPCKIIGKTDEYMLKNRKKMKVFPVFDIHYNNMTIEDKIKQKEILSDKKIGYDE